MLNIAVLVYNLINNYNHTVVDGIYDFFEDKPDVRLIVAPANVPHREDFNYDYQFWSSVKLLRSKQIDGVILIPNLFTNYIDYEKLTKELQDFVGKPVVSIARSIDIPGSKYTYNSCENAYEKVINHLKNKHDRKRIGFFGAGLVNSPESKERFAAFKKALENNDLEFYPELVFEGDFTPGTATEVMGKKFPRREDINFDAICCVNDFTAVGCLYHFEKINVSVPDDVILVGYDDQDIVFKVDPTLSSISQDIPGTGYKAAELIYDTLKGKSTPERVLTDSTPVYRKSCGCVSKNSYTTAYCDEAGVFHEKDERRKKAEASSIKKHQEVLAKIYNMLNLMDCNISLDNIIEALDPAMVLSDFSVLMVGIYDSPLFFNGENDFIGPDTAKVRIGIDTDNKIYKILSEEEGLEINLKDKLMPDQYERFGSGLYFFHPVYLRDKNLGYMICRTKQRNYILSAINLKAISDIIVNAYEYSQRLEKNQKLIENNMNLSLRAKTDELTKVFNRRGVMEYGSRIVELSTAMGKTGSIFFFDLDGLKKINDTYGHKIGDLAIKTEAEVLKACFRESDLVGRLSGDEFCAIAPGFSVERIDVLRRKLLENNKKFSEAAGLPFTLSISVGAVKFGDENNDLEVLLQEADLKLYEEKELKHSLVTS